MIINEILRQEIELDIARCEFQTEVKGSRALYEIFIAKYSVLDPNFCNGLPNNGKAAVLGSEYDYRKELKATAAKLGMWLLTASSSSVSSDLELNPLLSIVDSFIRRGEDILIKEERIPKAGVLLPTCTSGPLLDAWMGEIYIFNERNLKDHPLYKSILSTYTRYKQIFSPCEDMLGHLRALNADKDFWQISPKTLPAIKEKVGTEMSKKVFIVHGHDDDAKRQAEIMLLKAGYEAIILHKQANKGKTIIEKIEEYTNVPFAVVLYTGCDLGRPKEKQCGDERYRARQNVVFEHGYLIGKLGREHVCALVKGDVETPGDIDGVVYIQMDDAGTWENKLAKEMNAVGLSVDLNNL